MTLLGIVGIEDPLHPGVREAVTLCQQAGVTIKMCTADNVLTAHFIALQCGIYTAGGIIMEGPVFRQLSPQEMLDVLPRLQVLARSSPLSRSALRLFPIESRSGRQFQSHRLLPAPIPATAADCRPSLLRRPMAATPPLDASSTRSAGSLTRRARPAICYLHVLVRKLRCQQVDDQRNKQPPLTLHSLSRMILKFRHKGSKRVQPVGMLTPYAPPLPPFSPSSAFRTQIHPSSLSYTLLESPGLVRASLCCNKAATAGLRVFWAYTASCVAGLPVQHSHLQIPER